ncbi:MAG: cupin domain-containing protein [Firmicutes bacterium]|nr:cupin domain-containing protein [Bacillota bacterium]
MAATPRDDLRDRERAHLFEALPGQHLGALWRVYANALTPEPVKREVPHRWAWKDLRPLLYEAARLVPTEEAERRVLMLLNPGLGGEAAITPTLYAGMQIILPGEIARSHRHTPNAIRFIVEGEGAFTAVNGERTVMKPGDFVTTPTWVWHDHGNESDQAVVWLDGLDLPLVATLSSVFYQKYPDIQQPVSRPIGDSSRRYARGFSPARVPLPRHYSPIVNYPYVEAREALATMAESDHPDDYDGYLLQYINPLTGGPVLPTMAAYLQWIPPHSTLKEHQHTSAAVYLGVEGRGVITIDGQAYAWEPHDVIVVPSWCRHQHQNPGDEPAILFSFTDDPVIRALALYREAD